MKIIKHISVALACACFSPAFAGVNTDPIDIFHHTRLLDIDQNQAYESESRAVLFLEQPVYPSYKIASVNFITGSKSLEFNNMEFEDPTIKECQKDGFELTSCPTGQHPASLCPHNQLYFDRCCDDRYKYDKSACIYPMTISGDTCGGKYMCYCDRSLYPYTSCSSPKVTNGDRCVENGVSYYSSCVCPSNYTQTCSAQNQQGVGTACSENGSTKYTACQCKVGYNQTCSDLGPVRPTDYCLMNGIKYFNSCKTCENKCSLASCPAGATCTYEDCSQKYCLLCENKCSLAACPAGAVCNQETCSGKYCAVGCAIGYKDLDNYWCNGAMRCWFK